MGRKKTSIMVDDAFWREFLSFTVRKHGSTRMVSAEVEKALREYLTKHGKEAEL